MARNAQLIYGLWQRRLCDHPYGAGAVAQAEILDDQNRCGIGDRAVDGDFS